MSAYPWQFRSRLRHHAFGWRSETPIQRIKEAISEIKQVARKEPVLAADGAVIMIRAGKLHSESKAISSA